MTLRKTSICSLVSTLKNYFKIRFRFSIWMRLYPPENSKYSSSDAFDETENELISIINVDKRYVALTGDFN